MDSGYSKYSRKPRDSANLLSFISVIYKSACMPLEPMTGEKKVDP